MVETEFLDNYTVFLSLAHRMWCGANRLGDSSVHTLADNSAIVNPAGPLLLTQRGKTRMDGVGIVFEFYSPSLSDIHVLLYRL